MRASLRWLAVFAILLGGWAAPLPPAQAGSPAAPVPQPVCVCPPELTGLSPSTVAAGSPDFTLTVDGSGLISGTVVTWNNSFRATTYVSSTRLSAVILATDVTAVGPYSVTLAAPSAPAGHSPAAVAAVLSPLTVTVYLRHAQDTTADGVLGQPNFITNTANNPLMPAGSQLNYAEGVAVDPHSGRVYVADTTNNRVLSWPSAAAQANGQAADRVFGQPDFTSYAANRGQLTATASSLNYPSGLTVDPQGRLYVADCSNNRVLAYDTPLTSAAADRVFGQGGSFTATAQVPVTAASLYCPTGVRVDGQGRLYVADSGNNRALEYDTPLTSATANRVFGQGGSFTSTAHLPVNADSLYDPVDVALDPQGRLYVADESNNRVLAYDTPLTRTTADRVFGQSGSFTATHTLPITADSLNNPTAVALDALGDLFVDDWEDERVLEYDAPPSHDTTADHVFGQSGSFTSKNYLPITADTLDGPNDVVLDAQGNLYVADSGNHRVLEFDQPVLRALFLPLAQR